jgi:spermidine synthase
LMQRVTFAYLRLDKGTFDAIALSAPESGPHPTELYPRGVEELLAPGGYFLITCESKIATSTAVRRLH